MIYQKAFNLHHQHFEHLMYSIQLYAVCRMNCLSQLVLILKISLILHKQEIFAGVW
jgi:hypothetical protein